MGLLSYLAAKISASPQNIVYTKANADDAHAMSCLLKKAYGGLIRDDQIDVAWLRSLIDEHRCIFDIAIDTLAGERAIVGLTWWYFHMPAGWTGDRKALSQAVFEDVAAIAPKDFSEQRFDVYPAEGIQEREEYPRLEGLNEPVLYEDKECVDIAYQGKGIGEGQLLKQFQKPSSGLAGRLIDARMVHLPYSLWWSPYGATKPYPEEVKDRVEKLRL